MGAVIPWPPFLASRGTIRGRLGLALSLAAVLLLAGTGSQALAATAYQDIGLPSAPLTKIAIGSDLSCQTAHTGDSVFEFFPSGATPGDCGTFVFVDGILFTPDFANHSTTATSALGTRTAFTAVSQTAPAGAGTADDPRQLTTTVNLGSTGIQIVETDFYVSGQEYYGTTVTFNNSSGTAKDIVLYRAGDCYLQGSDKGYGFSTANNAVGCSANANNSPAGRVEVWTPLSPGATFTENTYSTVWAQIAAHAPFPNTCGQCSNFVDNGAGLSWALSVAPGNGTAVRSSAAGFSPTGELPPGSTGGGPPGQPGAGNPGQAPPLPPECQNPTTLMVTCAQLSRPGVCGPTGTIFPACYFPVRLPTVCGPSFGTVLAPCQSQGPYTVACGSFGTILSQCNLPRPNIPQVCGPSSSTVLPPCTGGNNPVTVCGPSFGSVVPACNFSTRINARRFDLNTGRGQIDLTLSCGSNTRGSNAGASRNGGSCPSSGTITLADWRVAQKATLVSAASRMAHQTARFVRSCIQVNNYTCQGTIVPESEQQTTLALADLLAAQNAGHFVTRTSAITDEYLFAGGPPADFFINDVEDNLIRIESLVPGRPDYRRPELLTRNQDFGNDVVAVASQLSSAVDEFKLLLRMSRSRPRGSSAALTTTAAAEPTLIRRSNTIVLPFKLRRGHKTRIRIKLRRGDVRKLARYVGGRRVLPVRIIVSFSAKPRPVARVFDIRLPVKPKTAKKPSRKGGGH
jgi:hypothetical protein